jgi:hypothetical protein
MSELSQSRFGGTKLLQMALLCPEFPVAADPRLLLRRRWIPSSGLDLKGLQKGPILVQNYPRYDEARPLRRLAQVVQKYG